MKAAYIRDGQFGTGTFDDPVPGKGQAVEGFSHGSRLRAPGPASHRSTGIQRLR